ncbi:MAG: transposase [Acidiferrobacterales bacterium]
MGRRRRKFSPEFKLEAVRLVTECGHSVAQVARDLDLGENLLRRWIKELGPDYGRALTSRRLQKANVQETEKERLQQERVFLKKATAFFVKGRR